MTHAVWATVRGRKAAEALMRDTCTIRPVTGQTTNPTTGVVTPIYGAAVYTGKCKIQSTNPYPSNPDAGGHNWTLEQVELHLPLSGTGSVDIGHLAEITASFDLANVGRKFRIKSLERKTFQTAARFHVEEVAA